MFERTKPKAYIAPIVRYELGTITFTKTTGRYLKAIEKRAKRDPIGVRGGLRSDYFFVGF